MLKNDGTVPPILAFSCKNGCELNHEIYDYSGYDLEGLENVGNKGRKPTGGSILVNTKDGNVAIHNLEIDGYICNYPIDGKAECVIEAEYKEKQNYY